MSERRQTRNKKVVQHLTQQKDGSLQGGSKSKASDGEPFKDHNRLTAKQKKLDTCLEKGRKNEKAATSRITKLVNCTRDAKKNLQTLNETYTYTKKSKRTSDQVIDNKNEIDDRTKTNNNEEEKANNNYRLTKQREDDFLQRIETGGFEKTDKCLKINVFKPAAYTSHNMVHHLQHMAFGIKSRLQMHEVGVVLVRNCLVFVSLSGYPITYCSM